MNELLVRALRFSRRYSGRSYYHPWLSQDKLNAVSDLLAQLVSEGLFEHRVSKRGERWRLTRAGREKARTVITAAEKKALGQAIHDLREQQGISLREFAEQTGLSQQGIINIEKGRSKPRTRTLECMARVLNVTVDELAKAA